MLWEGQAGVAWLRGALGVRDVAGLRGCGQSEDCFCSSPSRFHLSPRLLHLRGFQTTWELAPGPCLHRSMGQREARGRS